MSATLVAKICPYLYKNDREGMIIMKPSADRLSLRWNVIKVSILFRFKKKDCASKAEKNFYLYWSNPYKWSYSY